MRTRRPWTGWMVLALAGAALWGGCSSSEDDDPAPLPAWESYYGACRATAVTARESGGTIYAGTQNNGFRFHDGTGWHHLLRENSALLSNVVRDVALDGGGRCWIASDRGISLFNGSVVSAHHTAASTGGGLPSDDVRCLFFDSQGRMWVGTDAGAAFYDGGSWQGGFTQAAGLASDTVSGVAEDGTGRIWFAHPGHGLSVWDGAAYVTYDTGDGLAHDTVDAAAFDAAGTGWFATHGGLAWYDGSFGEHTTANSPLPSNTVRDVCVSPSGAVWAATAAGVARLEGTSWNVYTEANGLFYDQTRCCFAHGGRAFAGSDLGLNWYDATGGWEGDILANAPLSANAVRHITTDAAGRLWFATEYGVTRKDGGSWEAWSADGSALSGNFCISVAVEADGTAWIGTFLNGLNRFDEAGWQTFTTSNSDLPSNLVSDIEQEAGGDLWLSTWNGVSRFDRASGFTNYRASDGLGSNIVNCIALDPDTGEVWAGTLGGLSRFNGTSWATFTTTDGLPANVINDVAFRPGEVWAATASGGVAWTSNGGATWMVCDAASGDLPSDDARSLAVHGQGDVYVATAAGLAVRVGSTWTSRTTANAGLVLDNLDCVHIAPGSDTVYIGTLGGGVSVYRPEHLPTQYEQE